MRSFHLKRNTSGTSANVKFTLRIGDGAAREISRAVVTVVRMQQLEPVSNTMAATA